MAKNILVVGLGDFGSRLAREFNNLGYEVLGVDINEERVRELSDVLTKVVQGDATSPGLWGDLPTKQVDIGIIAFSTNTAANLLAALLLKKTGVKTIVAKSGGELHTELLKAVGVSRVIEPNKESALRAIHILGTDIEDYMEVTKEFGIAKVMGNDQLKGMTIGQLVDKYNATVVILRRDKRVILEPPDTEEIELGDTLLIVGTDQDLRSLPGMSRPNPKDEQVA
ncbi:MAG: TrkA family potassium uptake protein [Dehalococcoidia bacterium]|nr:TrkA family potassium uptake protein [Dehalococcoidia bacterium]